MTPLEILFSDQETSRNPDPILAQGSRARTQHTIHRNAPQGSRGPAERPTKYVKRSGTGPERA